MGANAQCQNMVPANILNHGKPTTTTTTMECPQKVWSSKEKAIKKVAYMLFFLNGTLSKWYVSHVLA